MLTLDYILLGIIVLFALLGLKKGFLGVLGSLLGIILAILVASRLYPVGAGWLGGANWANVVSFIIIFGLSSKIIGLVFWILGKIFQLATVLPFIASFDRFIGLILGFVQGIFVCGIVLYFASKYPMHPWLTEQMARSVVSMTLLQLASIFIPFFPEAIKKIKAVI